MQWNDACQMGKSVTCVCVQTSYILLSNHTFIKDTVQKTTQVVLRSKKRDVCSARRPPKMLLTISAKAKDVVQRPGLNPV
eukprot:scaffold9684_cov194-Amphora_coffeaeformis.AAC.5